MIKLLAFFLIYCCSFVVDLEASYYSDGDEESQPFLLTSPVSHGYTNDSHNDDYDDEDDSYQGTSSHTNYDINYERYLKRYLKNAFLLGPKENCGRKWSPLISKRFGNLLGLVSAICTYNLGKDFWARPMPNDVGSTVSSIICVIPLFCLLSKITGDQFEEFAKGLLKDQEKTVMRDTCDASMLFKLPLEVGGISGSSIQSIAITYITEKYYHPQMGLFSLFLSVPTFVTSTTVGYWSLKKNAGLVQDFMKKRTAKNKNPEHPISMELKIKENLDKATNYITDASYEEMTCIKDICDKYQGLVNNPTENECGSQFLQKILEASISTHTDTSEQHEKTVAVGTGKNYFANLGWAIGWLGSWTVAPVVEAGTIYFLNSWGVSDGIATSVLSKSFGVVSGLVLSSLTSYAAKTIFQKIYNESKEFSCNTNSRGNLGRRSVNGLMFIFAGLSTLPRVDLGIQYFPDVFVLKPFVITCGAIARTALDYWSMDNVRNEIVKKFKQRPIDKNYREPVLTFLQDIKTSVSKLKHKYLQMLYRKVTTPHEN